MKIKLTASTQLNGELVKSGLVVDLPDDVAKSLLKRDKASEIAVEVAKSEKSK